MERTPDDEALLSVARLVMDVSVRAAEELGGLSPVQLRALTALRGRSGLNLAQLAEEMGVTVSTASRLVDRLVTAGWVHRGPSPHTRREISLGLTDVGRGVLREYDDGRVAGLRACLDTLPPERRAAVVGAFAQFAEATRS
ncbi:MAG TPA: MarR family transcriptional regulator [Blastococcus sp.]|nr:MarR family transcriptional regulator [Blastococcus sp.]